MSLLSFFVCSPEKLPCNFWDAENSSRVFQRIQNPSLHQGTCSKAQFFSSLFFNSGMEIFKVFTLIERLRNDKEHALNSSQSVNEEYLSINLGLNSIFSAL